MNIKKRVLIIDDEQDFCFFVRSNLESTGEFEVLEAHNGAEGIKAIGTKKPDLVLLDVIMPEVTGPDVADFIMSNPAAKDIPFIFLTAIVTKDEIGVEPMKEIKGHMFIQKPVDLKTLVESVRMTLAKSNQEHVVARIMSRAPLE
jgi:CheY-like chemotaxis protein